MCRRCIEIEVSRQGKRELCIYRRGVQVFSRVASYAHVILYHRLIDLRIYLMFIIYLSTLTTSHDSTTRTHSSLKASSSCPPIYPIYPIRQIFHHSHHVV